jgi:glycosyltransferase involved in cell wall biosynthesis
MEAGGAQKVAYIIHEQLLARGYDSELLFLYTKRPAYSGLHGVESLMEGIPERSDYWSIANILLNRLRSHKTDVLITHTHYSNILGHFIGRAAGVRKRIAVHHNPLPTYPLVARILDWAFGQTGYYTKIVAVSDAVAHTSASYPKRYTRLLSRVYNGILPPNSTVRDIRREWNIPSEKPLIVNVGRLSRQKNQATLLRALWLIPDVHLVIIGDGELSTSLRHEAQRLRVSDRVHFTGELSSPEVHSFLATADVFVLPSLWEAMPMSVLEAMQASLPIVLSNLPTLREVLAEAAFFVAPDDSAEFAQVISRFLDNKELAREFGLRAKRRASLFSADRMVEAYTELIG